MGSNRDCGDKTCSMEFRFLPNCVLYVDEAADKICDYPCSFLNCQSELHQFMLCPTWFCTSKTTTQSPDISTLSPLPPPLPTHSSCSGEVCIPSLVFNGLFGLAFLALIAMAFIRRRRAQGLARFYGEVKPYFVESQGPIIRNSERSERIPLLNTEQSRVDPDSLQQNLPNFYEQIQAAVLPVPAPMQETAF